MKAPGRPLGRWNREKRPGPSGRFPQARQEGRAPGGRGSATSWDRVAQWYDGLVGQKGSDFHRSIIIPGAVRLLECRAGDRVLDVGCGQGVLCRELAKLGVEAVGVDASEELIEAARARSRPAREPHGGRGRPGRERLPRYLALAAQALESLAEPAFDAAACLLAIQNMDPFEPVLLGCAARLKAGGRLVLVMMHPSFRIPRQSGWGWDEARQLQYRRVDAYLGPLKVPIQAHPGNAPDLYTWSFHRPLEAYVGALVRAGFLIDRLEEWPSDRKSEPGTRSRAENRARAEIPLFMALRAVKSGS
ncbi:MAG: methyltransferase domain-containing protein [Candidatus Wallbacteria bacterium]|nr:methyltransferase domain-containing protein [Candidatus Wallbacteria bacterium]